MISSSFIVLQHVLFIIFTIGKTLKKRHPKMVTDTHISLDTNTMNLGIMLQLTTKSDYQSTTSRPSFGIQFVTTCPLVALLLVDLFDLMLIYSTSNLPSRTISTFDFLFMSLNSSLRVQTTSTFDLLSIPSNSTISQSTSTRLSLQRI